MSTSRVIPWAVIVALFLLWIEPGLVDRDLWKADEPYSFGIVHHIEETGDWVVPTLTGQPFLEKPPLFYLTAAGFVRIFSPPLQPHDAARLATAFFMVLTIIFTGLAAKELAGRDAAVAAVLLLIGSAGLQITAHKLITDVALIAGLAAALYGFALHTRRPVAAGFWIGMGTGIGFMAKGLLAPGFVGLIALALPAAFPAWRKRTYAISLLAALITALPWLIIWPAALYLRSPAFFTEWFWYQNLGRFLGFGDVGRTFTSTFYLAELPWFALPSLPLALWTVWRFRKAWRERPAVHLPLTAFLVMFSVLTLSKSMRDLYALPMLLPLVLLAAGGSDSLSKRAERIIGRTSLALFGCLALFLWIAWVVNTAGEPSFLVERMHRLQPDYVPAINVPLLLQALFTSAALFFIINRSARYVHAGLFRWTAGIVLVWGLVMTLWLPWIDSGSGYRLMFQSLKKEIPSRYQYILTEGLGESERALLQYYTGVLPQAQAENDGKAECNLLLTQNGSRPTPPLFGSGWRSVWEWRRPRHAHSRPKEIFTLYAKRDRAGNDQCGELDNGRTFASNREAGIDGHPARLGRY